MTGTRPAGDAWTADDDRKLLAMSEANMQLAIISRKVKRTIGAVQSRRAKLRRLARCNILLRPGRHRPRWIAVKHPAVAKLGGASDGGAALGDGWRAITDRDGATAGE